MFSSNLNNSSLVVYQHFRFRVSRVYWLERSTAQAGYILSRIRIPIEILNIYNSKGIIDFKFWAFCESWKHIPIRFNKKKIKLTSFRIRRVIPEKYARVTAPFWLRPIYNADVLTIVLQGWLRLFRNRVSQSKDVW